VYDTIRMPRHNYDCFFPFSKIRPEQRKAIEFALDAFENGKRYVVLNMGTGCGKSATAVTIARYMQAHGERTFDEDNVPLSGAYVLTTQKVLQQQYLDDFGPGVGPSKNLMLSIKSSSNYKCGFYPDQTCAESRRVLNQLGKKILGTEFHKHCKGFCGYSKDKQDFIESPISVTNFSYFFAETMYSKKLTPRDLLIIDECHNTETELGKFVEVTFSEKFAKEILKCKIPQHLNSQIDVFDWIKKTYQPSLAKYFKQVEKAISQKLNENSVGFSDLSKQFEMLDKHICKVDRFLSTYTNDNWICNIVHPDDFKKRAQRKFEFKPVDVSRFSYENLFKFGGRSLLLSATIIDKHIFCQSIGLKPNDIEYLSIESPFPAENRPIHFVPVGSLSKATIDNTLPNLVEAVKMLLEQHHDQKGIIHCVNFRIAQHLVDSLKSPRLLSHNSENRDEILKSHISSKEPTVLVSPSMMEGVDLAGDASRFQILCKVPFPYLGDQVIKKRMENNKQWYTYQTIKSVVQAMGRSIRNETDHASSYILDADWERFFRMNRHMFPADFIVALS
jgi:ATP-dependent DNA helicase DinG